MSPRLKRIIIIIGFLALVGLLGFALYFFFFRPFIAPPVPEVAITPVPGLPPSELGLPPTEIPTAPLIPTPLAPVIPTAPEVFEPLVDFTADGGITAFSILEDDPVLSPTLSTNGKDIIYYNEDTDFFYRITPDGQKNVYSTQAFANVEEITWSPDNTQAVLEFPDGSNIVYDFEDNRSITLPRQWKDFAFSPQGNQLAFKDIKLDKENRFISVSDLNGSSVKRIEPLGDQDEEVQVTWSPNNQYIALYRQGIDAFRSDIYFIGFNDENFRTVTAEGRDLRFDWSPSGRKMIYSVYNGASNYIPELWMTFTEGDLLGTGKNKLNLQTWADKCTFAEENTVYCAVPRSLERGSGIVPSFADDVPDDIYKIDLLSGRQELVAQPVVPTTIDSLIVSGDKQTLYWVEKGSNHLNKMNL